MSQTPEELAQKIKEAQDRDTPSLIKPRSAASRESSKAIKMGTDFISAMIVGVVFGYWIDRWLDTKPIGIIVFLFLGFGAGFMNIYRAQTRKDKG